jgi:hypothetical protein
VSNRIVARNNEERRRANEGEDVGARFVLSLWICNLSAPSERWADAGGTETAVARSARALARSFRVSA